MLAKYYIDILSIGKDSVDGQKLLNYRAPKNVKQVHLYTAVFSQNPTKHDELTMPRKMLSRVKLRACAKEHA